jgi:hypothetical protein
VSKEPVRLNRIETSPDFYFPGLYLMPSSILIPVRPKDGEALKKLPVGTWLNGRITQPRNPKTHRLYFKVIALACAMWPDDLEPFGPDQAKDEDLLRAWLQCKAQYCHWWDFSPENYQAVIGLMKDIRGENKFCFVRPINLRLDDGEFANRLRVYVPDSIEYEKLGEEEFRPIKESVFEIIQMVLGVTIEDLLKAAKEAA